MVIARDKIGSGGRTTSHPSKWSVSQMMSGLGSPILDLFLLDHGEDLFMGFDLGHQGKQLDAVEFPGERFGAVLSGISESTYDIN